MTNLKVLISGASVAGPALAYWLHRHGFQATIVERAPALRDGGYAVDFRGEAHLTVLRRMGILADLERVRTGTGSMSYVNSAGKPQAELPADMFAGDIEILRGDLARILYDATRQHTEYVFGDSVTSLAEDAHGVTVSFEHGAPRRFDLVIGADGLHSTTRRLARQPPRARPHRARLPHRGQARRAAQRPPQRRSQGRLLLRRAATGCGPP
ncbi:FAD-dependent monooxygenase [Streptomyces lydicus]|uniref:FAD-dependent monooxygenase n=1 Tax=Streptomyces lydicus TaxID=47763 RepID=UPI0033EE5EB1